MSESGARVRAEGWSERLQFVWSGDRSRFNHWVRDVADAFDQSELTLETAARLVDSTPAELEAVLHVALMDDTDLELVAKNVPPKTTWFLFASATSEGVQAGLAALAHLGDEDSAFDVVSSAIRDVQGPDEAEMVAALSAEVFFHMAKKAKQYGRLNPRDRKALGDFAKRKKGGRPLTPRQVAYAQGLLHDLVEAKAVKRESPDGDQPICDQVLDALGLP